VAFFYFPYLAIVLISASNGKPCAHAGGVHITSLSRSVTASG
jgi:hypothetical protein